MAQVPCPQCNRLARIIDRFTLQSTDGPVEHIKISCPGGHVLTPLVEQLWGRPEIPQAAPDAEADAAPRFARAS